MRANQIPPAIEKFARNLPRFPDGRIDYTNSPAAPVINIFVEADDKVLLLKRSNQVLAYKEKWNSLGGFLDEEKPLRAKILEELKEELNIAESQISRLYAAEPFEKYDSGLKRTWIIHPVLVKLKQKPDVQLNWEHTDRRWIDPKELPNFDHVPGLEKVLKRLIPHL